MHSQSTFALHESSLQHRRVHSPKSMGACSTLYCASGQLDSIQEVMQANAGGKAAGQQLLQQLPWQLTMRARLRSLALLGLIAAALWVREIACACVLLRRIGLQSEPHSSPCLHARTAHCLVGGSHLCCVLRLELGSRGLAGLAVKTT